MAGALCPLLRRPPDRPRLDDRERRAPLDTGRPRLLGGVAGLGGQRLPPHLRRLPAARRTAGRPVRAPPVVPVRARAVHRHVARVRAGRLAGVPGRSAGAPGLRRRDRVGGRAVADHDHLHRPRRAREGDGDLRFRALRWRHRRSAARRRAHRPVRLELDLPGQPPDRDRGLPVLPLAAPGRQRRRGGPPPRHRRRRDGHRGCDARDLCRDQRQRERLDVRRDARPARGRRRAVRRLHHGRGAGRRAADSAWALPQAQHPGSERRGRVDGGGDVRLVLPTRPVSPAGARLQPAGGGAGLPADHARSWASNRSRSPTASSCASASSLRSWSG